MTDILIILLSSAGALFVLLSAVGILRMPDTYIRISVNTKAATLGVGLVLIATAVFFKDTAVTTRVIAIFIFLLLTAPVGAHLIGRTSYFTGVKLWKGSKIDELKGKYNTQSQELQSENVEDEADKRHSERTDQ